MTDMLEDSVIASAKKRVAQAEMGWGMAHPKLIKELQNLSDLYLVLSEFDKAEPIYWRILDIQHRIYGATHMQVSETLLSLGELYESRENLKYAEQFYIAALWIIDQNENCQELPFDILGRLLLKLYGICKLRDDKVGACKVESRLYCFLKKDFVKANKPLHLMPATAVVA